MKTALRIGMTILLLVIFSGVNFAQDASASKAAKASGQTVAAPAKFVDENKNGICDNHESKGASVKGKNFIDKNCDGKCDKCGTSGNCKGSGSGCGKGSACGKGEPKGNCCGSGHQHKHGCSGEGSNSATKPAK